MGILLAALYILPTIVAGVRAHRQFAPIAIINLFLGWTLVGWVLALAWASSDTGSDAPSKFVLLTPVDLAGLLGRAIGRTRKRVAPRSPPVDPPPP